MTQKNTLIFIGIFTIALSSGALAHRAHAASIDLHSSSTPAVVGGEFVVNVDLNTPKDNVNAIAARIIFPPALLSFKGWSDAGSVVDLWVVRPDPEASGTVAFSGIIPGGYIGAKGRLVSLIFTPLHPTTSYVSADSIVILKNDGKGTPLGTSSVPLVFTAETAPFAANVSVKQDQVPPQAFRPIVARDPNIYDGDYFLAFSTTDKESGVDHYEVKEGARAFLRATSPYRLLDQSLSEPILVVAYDRAGNRRIESYNTPSGVGGRVFLIASGLIVVVLLWLRMTWLKRRSAHPE